jgi:hypothetical protein
VGGGISRRMESGGAMASCSLGLWPPDHFEGHVIGPRGRFLVDPFYSMEGRAMEGVLLGAGAVVVLVGFGALVEATRYWRGRSGRKLASPSLGK